MTVLYFLLTLVVAAVILLAAYLYLSAPRSSGKRAGMEKLTVDYSHRGLHGGGIPENSLPAFSASAEAWYGVELDVQLSSDGIPVVFHDYTLLRMCGEDIKLSSRSAAELSWRRLEETKHTIPTLEDALRAVRGRVPVLVELKGETTGTELCEAVARVLARYDGKYCVQSFNPYLLGWFRRHAPRIARGQLYTDFRKSGTRNPRTNFLLTAMLTNYISRPDFISVEESCLDYFPVRLMRGLHKLTVFVWTVRDDDCHARFRSMKYSCIFEGIEPDAKKN